MAALHSRTVSIIRMAGAVPRLNITKMSTGTVMISLTFAVTLVACVAKSKAPRMTGQMIRLNQIKRSQVKTSQLVSWMKFPLLPSIWCILMTIEALNFSRKSLGLWLVIVFSTVVLAYRSSNFLPIPLCQVGTVALTLNKSPLRRELLAIWYELFCQ